MAAVVDGIPGRVGWDRKGNKTTEASDSAGPEVDYTGNNLVFSESVSKAPLIVVVGPTASGKTALALRLAETCNGEIVSCDSVAIYWGLDIGSAKPSVAERERVPHHGLDLLKPDEAANAGDYARAARVALLQIQRRGRLAIVAGGTGLYLRALLYGLAPAPPRDEALRERLRRVEVRRGAGGLHRLLSRLDRRAAGSIHPNDTPKLIRSLEVTLLARRPQTEQWEAGREPLQGVRVLQIGLNPPRAALYERINQRAAAMFSRGLLEETAAVRAEYGDGARGLGSLGYVQALRVLRGEQGLAEAVAEAQQGHRNYAKRQLTWFRREPEMHWIEGFGDEPAVQEEALRLVREHLIGVTADQPEREGKTT
ncbi:MAG: tRNA (adenosine(37)-N6)-dimethylallyltransferase MiaA [Janthinobacterium lividum]